MAGVNGWEGRGVQARRGNLALTAPTLRESPVQWLVANFDLGR